MNAQTLISEAPWTPHGAQVRKQAKIREAQEIAEREWLRIATELHEAKERAEDECWLELKRRAA